MKLLKIAAPLILLTSIIFASQVSFTGMYATNWGTLSLIQKGSVVEGTYEGQFSGTIKGTVKNNRLDYEWTQQNGEKGRGYFELFDGGKTIKGRWGMDADNTEGGEWEGKRTGDIQQTPNEGKGGGTATISMVL